MKFLPGCQISGVRFQVCWLVFSPLLPDIHDLDSAPLGGAKLHFLVPERKNGYFESLAEQGFQNNLPSCVYFDSE